MADRAQPLRLFLDTGVILEGCFGRWGASKGVLILATERRLYTVVLAEAVERELQRNVAYTLPPSVPREARDAAAEQVSGWLQRVRIERWPLPSAEDIERYAPVLMPVLRHRNDLPAVVSAVQARPDWVISANQEHWSDVLAERTGLRIVTPREFLGRLRPVQAEQSELLHISCSRKGDHDREETTDLAERPRGDRSRRRRSAGSTRTIVGTGRTDRPGGR